MTILTPLQQQFLKLFREDDKLAEKFYLSGGTALSEFHLHHRLSEDLDFFTDKAVDFNHVTKFINQVSSKLKAKKVEYNKIFDRRLFFLKFPKETLKVEFTEYPFPQLQKGVTQNGLKIDSLLDIAANKLFSIFNRFEPKDYVDLYFIINKKYPLSTLQKGVEKKFHFKIDDLNLGSQLAKAKNLTPFPKLLIKTTKNDIESFFLALSHSFKKTIFE